MTIKNLRLKLKLTQEECANYLGISRRTYQGLESEDADVNSIKYKKYCDMLENYESSNYYTNVVLGTDLYKLHNNVKDYKKRYCYDNLLNYIQKDYRGKVCILYGLRRTGKTTLLFQLLADLDIKKTAYIKVSEKNNMAELIKDIQTLEKLGIVNVLIDEVTLLSDFINSAATLSDIYSMLGMKIILSGTDSLGFMFAVKDELYDRNIMIHTSYISFKEFNYLLNIEDIDKYIEFGGTLRIENISFDDPDYNNDDVSFADDESTRKYIDSAISRNIQRSLRNNSFGNSFIHLRKLYDKNELTNVINRIVENMNHEFLLNVINERFNSSDLGSAKQLLLHSTNPNVQTALYDIDKEKVLFLLKKLIDVKEKDELMVEVSKDALNQVKTYLSMLDLIKDVNVYFDDGTKETRIIFTQPGMRYSITKALVYSLLNDEYFNTLSNLEKNIIIEKILSDVKGRMIEDIVLYETSRVNEKRNVFKYKFISGGEFDLVVYNQKDNSFDLFEIKHSDKIALENQTKYLKNTDMINQISKIYGTLNKKYVLYKGKDEKIKDVYYKNIEEYLKEL